MQINNRIYDEMGDFWWDRTCGPFASIRFFINPVRTAYFLRTAAHTGMSGAKTLLDIGCGGGLLSEEFAKAGYSVTGVDPSLRSIETARRHAAEEGLEIAYHTATGERLPFADASFDFAACCDVLEHVNDPSKVIGEIARVLKPGGLFFYDTINRTFASWLKAIRGASAWMGKDASASTENSHVWNMFIRPGELRTIMAAHRLCGIETKGIAPGAGLLASFIGIRKNRKGQIDFEEFGKRMKFRESADISVSYMGYGIRQ